MSLLPSALRRPRRAVVPLVAVALTLSGAGAAAHSAFAASGVQPSGVLPGGAFAFAQVDLDPSLSQKVAAVRLSRRVKGLGELAPGGLPGAKAQAVTAMTTDTGIGLTYADIAPWLGDRAGVAAYTSQRSTTSGVDVAVALQVRDEAAARVTLDKAAAKTGIAYSVRRGYALVALDSATLERVSAHTSSISQDPVITRDLRLLHGEQVLTGWADLDATLSVEGTAATRALATATFGKRAGSAAALALAPAVQALAGTAADGGAGPAQRARAPRQGRIVAGLHLTGSYAELQAARPGAAAGAGSPGALLRTLPSGVFAAADSTGYAAALSAEWSSLSAESRAGLADLGIRSESDLKAMAGKEISVVYGPGAKTGKVAWELQILSETPVRTATLWRRLAAGQQQDGSGYSVTRSGSIVSLGWGVLHANRSALVGDPAFTEAAPDWAGSADVAFVDIARVLRSLGSGDADARLWRGVRAGAVTQRPDGSVRVRLTVG